MGNVKDTDDFLSYCDNLDKEKTDIEPQTVEGNQTFEIREYVFLTKDTLVAMFSLLSGEPLSAVVQVDIRNEQPIGNVYATIEEAEIELGKILDNSLSNGWKVGYRGQRNFG